MHRGMMLSISRGWKLVQGWTTCAPGKRGCGAISDLNLISDLNQKFKHDLWRVKSELKLSQKSTSPQVNVYLAQRVYCQDIHYFDKSEEEKYMDTSWSGKIDLIELG